MIKSIHLNGVISKKEKLVSLPVSNLPNVSVAEASSPYANYYGQVPRRAKPNSLFLFTSEFYFLSEIISYAQKVEKCLLDRINIASAVLHFRNKQFSAIRLKNFPDYKQLANVQDCMNKQGIVFLNKINIEGEVLAKISKLFKLEEVDTGFYMDLVEDHKGYFTHQSRIDSDNFNQLMRQIKNNGNCKLFDAVQGELLLNGSIVEIVRIYSEGLDLELLKCIKKEFEKIIHMV